MAPDSFHVSARDLRLPDYAAGSLLLLTAVWWGSAIGSGSLWLDEVLYARAGYSIVSGNPFVNPTHMFAPFAKYVIGAGQLLFGPSAFGARVGIVSFGVLTLGVVYAIPRLVGRPWAGVFSVFGVAVIPLFSTHATSAMLDLPLVFSVTLLSGLVVLESQHTGSPRRDALVGITALLVCSTKSYGVVYALGPSVAYLLLRRREAGTITSFRRALIAAAGSFAVLYLPVALASPPDYYSGATLPAFVERVFDVPLLGGIAYAFGASFYHNLTGHAASSPSVLNFVSWMVRGGPFVVLGVLSAGGAFLLPERFRVGPTWLPASLLLPPLVMFVLILPKGFARYALPIFPIAVVYAVLLTVNAIDTLEPDPPIQAMAAAVLLLALVSPANAFLLGSVQLGADSKYSAASATLSDGEEGDTIVVAEQPVVLRWYLGEKRVGNYYFDPTEPAEFDDGDGTITVIGVSPVRPGSYTNAAERIADGDVDYVLLNAQVDAGERETPLRCGDELRSWEAYWTGSAETHSVSLWDTDGC